MRTIENMTRTISIMVLGTNKFSILPSIIDGDSDDKFNIICFNILDYWLPSNEENVRNRYYRDELRRVFRLLRSVDNFEENTNIELLKKFDYMNLDDVDLEINAYIQQVFDNKEDYESSYRFIENDVKLTNIGLSPLINGGIDLMITKGRKFAPLRYYYTNKELLQVENIEELIQQEQISETLSLLHSDEISDLEISGSTLNILSKSDVLVILVSDLISLAVLSRATKILKVLNEVESPILLVWENQAKIVKSFAESEIFELLNLGKTNDKMIDTLAGTVDYIFTSQEHQEEVNSILIESGYKVEDTNISNLLEDASSILKLVQKVVTG